MGEIVYQHKEYAAGKWETLPLSLQMGNIGSEVSRALRWKRKERPERVEKCLGRALELMDLSIAHYAKLHDGAKLKELCRAREELCDYFVGDNEYHTEPKRLMAYYDQFALMHVRAKKTAS